MIVYTDQKITVRTLAAEDADLLVKWLSDPQVLAYYEGQYRDCWLIEYNSDSIR